jgi:dynactin-6
MICDNSSILGNVEIGDGTIVHPMCHIEGNNGFVVVIGEKNIIEEKTRITDSTIGHCNLFQVGVTISNSEVCVFYS